MPKRTPPDQQLRNRLERARASGRTPSELDLGALPSLESLAARSTEQDEKNAADDARYYVAGGMDPVEADGAARRLWGLSPRADRG